MYSLSMVNKNNPYYIFIIELMISRSMSIPQKDSCIEHSRTLIKVSNKAGLNSLRFDHNGAYRIELAVSN